MKKYLTLSGLCLAALMLSAVLALISVSSAVFACRYTQADAAIPDPGHLFNDLGANLNAIQIRVWAKINDSFLSVSQIGHLINRIGGETDMACGFRIEADKDGFDDKGLDENGIDEEGASQLAVRARGDDISISMTAYKGYSPAGCSYGTYLTAEVLIDNPSEVNYNSVHCALVKLFRGLSGEHFVSTLYKGTLPGRLNQSSMNRVCREIFASCKGKIIEGIGDEGFLSLTGYSDYIEDSCLSAGSRKINLNVALRYSEYDDATCILLGTPVIFTGY